MLSGAVMSKLRNGHPVRAALAAKGQGVSAILSEDNIKKLMKAGKRGGKAVIKLAHDEIQANRAHGTGICEGGKFKMKHIGKVIHNTTKKIAGNPIVQDVVSQTAGDLAAAAAPELGPLGYAGAAYGTKKGMQAYAGSGIYSGGALGHPDHVGGKIKMKKIGKTIKKIGSNKKVQDLAFKGANMALDALASGEGEGIYSGGKLKIHHGAFTHGNVGNAMMQPVDSVEQQRLQQMFGSTHGGKIKMKKVGKTLKHIASNKHVQDIALKGAKMAMEAAMAGEGEGLFAGVQGGKLKMKHILHHAKKIASDKRVQDLALKAAKMGMEAAAASGEGLTAGGKLKMKHIGHAIKHIANNKHVQDLAFKGANMALDALASGEGEGLYASGRGQGDDDDPNIFTNPSSIGHAAQKGIAALQALARGKRARKGPVQGPHKPTSQQRITAGSVKRKVIDLIEDIGENRPRRHGESRVRQAIDLVERMRKPKGGSFVAGGALGSAADLSSITNVGAGGNLLSMRNPALRSQPDSQNFFFHTQFPPELAERMEGSGLYA